MPQPTADPTAANGLEGRLATLERRLGAPPVAVPCVMEGMGQIVAGDTTWDVQDFTLDRDAKTLTIRLEAATP